MILDFSSINSLKSCLKKGIGITVCPEISVMEELEKKELKKLDLKMTEATTSIIMISHVKKWRPPVLDQFMGISEEVIAGH